MSTFDKNLSTKFVQKYSKLDFLPDLNKHSLPEDRRQYLTRSNRVSSQNKKYYLNRKILQRDRFR